MVSYTHLFQARLFNHLDNLQQVLDSAVVCRGQFNSEKRFPLANIFNFFYRLPAGGKARGVPRRLPSNEEERRMAVWEIFPVASP